MVKILVCGDREWTNREVVQEYIEAYTHLYNGDLTIVHGACRGADRIAGEEAKKLGTAVEEFPAQWEEHGRAAGPIRNQEMIDQKPSFVLAFHPDITRSRGTVDTLKRAKKANIPVVLIDGE